MFTVIIMPLEETAISSYSVASSTPSSNYFISDHVDDVNTAVFETNVTLPNCTAYNAMSIAIVQNSGSDAAATLGNKALDEIADRMIDAYYKYANETLKKEYFDNNEEIDKKVRKTSYIDDPICFGIGWNAFLTDNVCLFTTLTSGSTPPRPSRHTPTRSETSW